MAGEVDDRTRIEELGAAVSAQLERAGAKVSAPANVSMFIRAADGSVQTRAGVQLRGPIEKPPAKLGETIPCPTCKGTGKIPGLTPRG